MLSLLKRICVVLVVTGVGVAENAAAFASHGQEVEVTIFYSADICGYLEPCG